MRMLSSSGLLHCSRHLTWDLPDIHRHDASQPGDGHDCRLTMRLFLCTLLAALRLQRSESGSSPSSSSAHGEQANFLPFTSQQTSHQAQSASQPLSFSAGGEQLGRDLLQVGLHQ